MDPDEEEDDLDSILESLYDEEDIDFVIKDLGIPTIIEDDTTDRLIKCSVCKGTGEVILFITIDKCSNCNGRGLVVES